MPAFKQALQQLHHEFTPSVCQLAAMMNAFQEHMAAGLAGKPRSLAMLPSWLTCPSGREQGLYLALDFGGTNARALLVELAGSGRFAIRDRCAVPLADSARGYNYTTAQTTASELFAFVAGLLAHVAPAAVQLPLGHTFSFPCRQTAVNDAILLYWTKEISTSGVVGQNVTKLLMQALADRNLDYIYPVAIVNDTVTTLLTAAYGDRQADIGSICGTGHNTCYLEPNPPGSTQPMYINIESGNFDQVPAGRYDRMLDSSSERPGAGQLEKMCSGRYLGELLRLVCVDLAQQGLLFGGKVPTLWQMPYILTTPAMAVLLAGSSDGLAEPLTLTPQEKNVIRTAAQLIVSRSARLAAATWAAILEHIDPGLTRQHTIAIDGALYEKLPGYASAIHDALQELLGEQAEMITCKLVKDGSGIGAALAAAIVHRPSSLP